MPTRCQGASKHTVFGRITSGFDVAVGGPEGVEEFTLGTKISHLWLKGKSSSKFLTYVGKGLMIC